MTGALDLGGIVTASAATDVSFNDVSGGPTALDWVHAVDLDNTGSGATFSADPVSAGGITIDLASAGSSVSGSLTDVDVAGILTGAADFSVTKEAVSLNDDGDSGTPAVAATLLAVVLSSLDLRVGGADVYATVTGGDLGVYSAAPDTADGRSWLAVDASGLGGSLHLGTVGTSTLSSVLVRFNRAAGTSYLLAWGSDVTGATVPSIAGQLTQIEGTLDSLEIGGFLTLSGHFDLTRSLVDVDLNADGSADVTGALLLALGLTNVTATVGVAGGPTFATTSPGTLALAVLRAPTPGGSATDDRTWLTAKGTLAVSFSGVTGLTLDLTSLDVAVNRADGSSSTDGAATPLDWTKALDLNGNATFGEAGVAPSGDQLAPGGIGLDLTAGLVQAAGSGTVRVFGFVDGSVSFVFTQRTVNVDADGNGTIDPLDIPTGPGARGPPDLNGATLTTLGLTVTSISIGTIDGPRLTALGGTLALAVVTPSQADQDAGDTRYWIALKSDIPTASLSGAPAFSLDATNVVVELNQAGGAYDPSGVDAAAAPLNWTIALSTGTVAIDGTTIDFTTESIQAAGDFGLSLASVVWAVGGFTLTSSSSATVDGHTGGLVDLTLSGVEVFAGAGASRSGTTSLDTSGAVGLHASAISGRLASLTDSSSAITYSAAAFSLGAASLTGLGSVFSFDLANGYVRFNDGPVAAKLDWSGYATEFAAIPASLDLAVGADFGLSLASVVWAVGGFTLTSSSSATVDGHTGGLVDLTLSGVEVFAGAGASRSGTTSLDTSGAVGLHASAISGRLASLTDSSSAITYSAAAFSLGAASLTGLGSVFSFDLANGYVRFNDGPVAAKLDWSGYATEFAAIPASLDLAVGADFGLSLASVVWAVGGFTLTSSSSATVDGHTGGLVDLTLSGVEVFAGAGASRSGTTSLDTSGAVGLHASAISGRLASLTDSSSAITYSAAAFSLGAASLTGLGSVFSFDLANGYVRFNDGPVAAKLDWSGYATEFAAIPASLDLAVGADFGLSLASVVWAVGGFTLTSSSSATVDGHTGGLVDLTLSGVEVFAGAGASRSGTTSLDTSGAVGLHASAISGRLASLTDSSSAITYSAAAFSLGAASLTGLGSVFSFDLANGYVRFNDGPVAAKLDWSGYATEFAAIPASLDLAVGADFGLSLSDFVYMSGAFTLDVEAISGGTLSGPSQAMVLTVTGGHVFAGIGGSRAGTTVTDGTIGFAADGIGMTFASIVDGATSYTGLRLTVASATLLGIGGLELYISGVDIRLNSATGGTSPTPLDWNAFPSIGLTLSGSVALSVEATVAISIGGLVAVAGTGSFSLSIVSGSGLSGETALKIAISGGSVWAGVGGGLNSAHTVVTPGTVGVSASGIDLTFAQIKTAAVTYTGLRLFVGSASLNGIPGVDAYVSNLLVAVNTSTLPGTLDWSALTIDGTGGTPFGLDLSGSTSLSVGGTLAIDIGGFVAAAGTFSLTKSVVSGSGLLHANALKLVVSGASLWIGVGGGLNGAHTAVVPGTIGIGASGVALTLAAITDTATSTSYTGLILTVGTASLNGVPGVTAYVSNVFVKVNKASGLATPLTWSALTIDGTGGTSFAVDLTGATSLSVGGTLGLDIGGFVAAAGSFTFENSTVSGGPITSQTALKLTVSSASFWAGVGGGLNGAHTAVTAGTVGISASGVNLTLAIVKSGTTSYTGLELTVAEASLVGIAGVQLYVTSLDVKLNQATAGSALNWSALTIDGGGSFGFSLSGDVALSVGGTLGLEIGGGFVAASGTFELTSQTVTGTGGAVTLSAAQAIHLSVTSASLWVGLGGSLGGDHHTVNPGSVGFSISGVNLNLASVKTATNTYTGLELTIGSASLTGIDLAQIDITNAFVRVNKVQTGTTKLDWAAFTGGPLFGLNLGASTDLSVGGTIALRLADFVWASASFALTQETLLVTPVGSTTSVSVTALEIGLANGNLFAGAGNPDSNGNGHFDGGDDPGSVGAVGVSFQNLSLGLVSAKTATGATYFALRARGTGALVGIDGFDIGGTLEVQMNTGKDSLGADAPAIDFTLLPAGSLSVPTGATPVEIDLGETLPIRVTGTAHLTISDFIYVSAGFSIEKGATTTVTLDDATTRTVNILKIGISNGHAFVGVGGPYWVTDPDGTVHAPASAGGALGIALSNVELGIALIKPTTGAESFYAITGGGDVALVGIDALTLSVQNLKVEVNGGNGLRVVDFLTSFGAGGLSVPTGSSSSVDVKFTTPLLRATGDVTLSISQFVYISGSFAFEKGGTLTAMPRTGTTSVDMSVLKIGANDVYAFAGIGGPYWVTDPDGTVHAPASAGSAIGLAIENVDFGLALMKPVVTSGPASTLSYYALSATVGSVSLVNPFGVTVSGSNLVIEVNGSNDPGHVADLSTRTIVVPTSGSTSITLGGTSAWGAELLHVEGDVTIAAFDLSLSAHVSFESTTRTNGTRVIKIAITNLSFDIGDPTVFHIGGASGNLFLSDEGFAAEFNVPLAFSVGDSTAGFNFSTTAQLAISTITHPIDETFNVGGSTEHLILPAGPYLRFAAIGLDIHATALGISATLHGDFQFEQITDSLGAKVIRIAAANVSMGVGGGGPVLANSGGTGVSLTGGSGAMILYSDGVAAMFRGTFNVSFPGADASSETILTVNTRGPPGDVNETITVNGTPVHLEVAANTFRLDVTHLSINFGDILTLTGDFTVQSGSGALAGATLYGARDVELFLGDGPYRLASGDVNPDAIGVLVSGGRVGVVDFGTGAFAIYAEGTASLVGLGSFVQLSAPVVVKVNKTGRAINTSIPINGGPSIDVAFSSAQFVEKFSVGTIATPATISFGQVVTLSGAIDFTLSPSGKVDVNIPNASVGISIPIDGSLTQAFSISGAAHFSFGGGFDFRLDDLRVSGFQIFGVGATIAAPATALRPPTATLASPYAGQSISSLVFDSAGSGHIDVVYDTLNPGGMNASTITDAQPEFILTGVGSGLVVNGQATQVDPNDPRTFRYSFTGSLSGPGTVGVEFIAGSFTDAAGASGAASAQSFYVYADGGDSTPPPTAVLVGPGSGAVVNASTLAARGYIDVKFLGSGAIAGVNGDEFQLLGSLPGTLLNVQTTHDFGATDVTQLNATTWRYTFHPANGVQLSQMFGAGEVTVQFIAGRWTAGGTANAASTAKFTIATDVQTAGTASNALTLGPLTLDGPSLALTDVHMNGTSLALNVAIGVNSATLGFGSGGSGGMSASLTGILGKFEVDVDLLAALTAVTSGDVGALLSAFSVPGKFSIDVATVRVEIPSLVVVTGNGIHVNWDPNYDPAAHGGAPQTLLTVRDADVTFPSFGVSATIMHTGTGPGEIPGLTVRTDGFKLGDASLTIRNASGAPIDFLGLLQFDDLRVGVTNFGVTFHPSGGPTIDSGSSFYFASGGVRFLPGKPINGAITDGTDPNTEALRATVQFDDLGSVKAFVFNVDTLKINLGSFLTLSAQNFNLNTGAGPNDDLVSFTSVGATVNIGSVAITGEARNFPFHGDGSFHTKPGFGVFLSVGGAGGDSFKWPSWLPIQINSIGITWPDIQADPTNFTLILSASVASIQGIPNLEFSGTIDGIQIDIGKLIKGEFPIVGIGAIGVSVRGDMFGGQIDATLIGGILKLDANGAIISELDTVTPVAQRVFFAGLEGGFSFSGIGGITIRVGLSELGPLSVALEANLPTPIVIYPPFGIAINDFFASVEFFKTLPSIDDPEQLRGADFQPPGAVSPENWLATLKTQVAKQALLLKQNPGMSGFAAAFTSPMTITGSAKIFDIYTSEELFNGQVVVKFSTDGKFLVIGLLNFFDNHLSDQRQALRRPVAHQLGRGDGAVPRRHPGPGPLPHRRGQAEDGLPQRLRHGSRLRRPAGAGREPDRRPLRPARGRPGLARRPERPRLHRLHLQRPERRATRHLVDQRRRVHDQLHRRPRRARHDTGAGARLRDDVPLLDEGLLHGGRHRHARLRREQVAVLRLEREPAAEHGRVGRRGDAVDGEPPLHRRDPDAGRQPHRRRDDGGRRRDLALRARRRRLRAHRQQREADEHQRQHLPLLPLGDVHADR